MAQVSWVFIDNQGGRNRIGVFHGDRTGHLLIHCNMKVLQVDFNVKDTRTYSFFVEDELIEIHLYKEKQGFSYDFHINRTADTPLNRARRVMENRNRTYMGLLIGGLVLMVALIFGAVYYFRHKNHDRELAQTSLVSQLGPLYEARLATEGLTSHTNMIMVQEGSRRWVYYGFLTTDSIRISGKFPVADTGLVYLPTGFPLQDRDGFEVRYLPSAPQTHRVDFTRPNDATIQNYFRFAANREHSLHPEKSLKQCGCLANIIIREKGWQALGILVHQLESSDQNPTQNSDTYLRLVREPAVENAVKSECWDQ